MGWGIMGSAQRGSFTGRTLRHKSSGRFIPDPRPPCIVRSIELVGSDLPSRRRYPIPSIGSRFGQLTVVGYEIAARGGLRYLVVRCACGADEHPVVPENLRTGRTTRCNACAKKASGYWTKQYYGYVDVCPDDRHRRRLLGRIGAILTRTSNGHRDYGGRGIGVYRAWRKDRRAFLAYLVTLSGWDEPLLEIDRIDNEKGYEPGNLRFIPHA